MADCPIMKLTDDCLISVFTYLTDIRDKLRLELVCWRFARLAAKQSAWKGSERLAIKVHTEQWRWAAEDYPFCEVNKIRLPLTRLSSAFTSILKRTSLHHLSLSLRKCRDCESRTSLKYEQGGQVLDAQLTKLSSIITSNSTRFKLQSFSLSGNLSGIDTLFLPLKYSNSSLKSFELTVYVPVLEHALYDVSWRDFYPKLWNLLGECRSLERFLLESDVDADINLVQPALLNKPLKEVYFQYIFTVTDGQYASICNNVSGSGITHLKTQGVIDFAGFVTRLNERARTALLEWKCENFACDLELLMGFLPRLGELLPNFNLISIEGDEPATTAAVEAAVTGFFDGMQYANPTVSHQLEIRPLLISDVDEATFKQDVTDFCTVSQISVTFREHLAPYSEPWAVLEKGNAKLVIHEVHMTDAMQESDGEDSEEDEFIFQEWYDHIDDDPMNVIMMDDDFF